ncbi:MAG: Bax inhibitor-1/YccA family protein [Hyphomicrobiaceae bacterium]|nr:Bax inhibitor-1/YccA family protein [Hyphomicrobiaceae bacterium]
MAEFDNQGYAPQDVGSQTRMDEGLRSYMLSVYNYMAVGIALTGVVSYMTFIYAVEQTAAGSILTPFGEMIYSSPLKWVIMFAPLGMVLLFAATSHKMSANMAQMVFWAFAVIMGLSLSSIFLRYTGTSISRVFFFTAASFAGLSLYGYTTKRNLSGWGSFLVMGLIGIIVASLVNMFFLQSSAMQWAISVIGVLVFAGLTAYDTQRIREVYQYVSHDAELVKHAAINGALSLYLDFINMFLMMLSLFGSND